MQVRRFLSLSGCPVIPVIKLEDYQDMIYTVLFPRIRVKVLCIKVLLSCWYDLVHFSFILGAIRVQYERDWM